MQAPMKLMIRDFHPPFFKKHHSNVAYEIEQQRMTDASVAVKEFSFTVVFCDYSHLFGENGLYSNRTFQAYFL